MNFLHISILPKNRPNKKAIFWFLTGRLAENIKTIENYLVNKYRIAL